MRRRSLGYQRTAALFPYTTLCRSRYETYQLYGIASRVANILDFVRENGVVDCLFSAFRTAAAIANREGDRRVASELLWEARLIARECTFPRLDVLARLALANLLVLDGPDEAIAILPAQSEPVFQTSHGPCLRAMRSLAEEIGKPSFRARVGQDM